MTDILMLVAAALGLIGLIHTLTKDHSNAMAVKQEAEAKRKEVAVKLNDINKVIETKKEDYEKYKNNVHSIIDKRRNSGPDKPDSVS